MKGNGESMSLLREKILSNTNISTKTDLNNMEEKELLLRLKKELVLGLKLEGREKLFLVEEKLLLGLIEKVVALEEEGKEDEELSKSFETRLDLPEEEWIELPPGKSIIDYYKERKDNK